MRKIVDQYHGDPSYAGLYSLTKDRPLAKEILKTASFDKEAAEDLPSSAFAWEAERRFPIHTKHDAVASILYRSKLGSDVPREVDDNLRKAAEIYELDGHLFSSTKQAAETQPARYALEEEQRLPLDSASQIKVAEHVLCRDYERLSLEKRANAFAQLVSAAQEQDIALQPLTLKMAGFTVSNTKTLVDWLEARAAATEGRYRDAFDKMASALRSAPDVLQNRKDLIKLASTIEELDKGAGLDKFYDRKLPDPLLTVFNTDKLAEAMCDVGGKQVPVSQLMQLPPEIWEQVDVPELAQVAQSGDAEQFAQIFNTLPVDIKMSLASYM